MARARAVKAPANPHQWTPEYLESLRHEADPTADALVAELFATDTTDAVARLHRSLVRQEGLPADLPPALARYLETTAELPAWADMELVTVAEEVLMSHGLMAFSILACASLPECYADVRGMPVLWLTQLLNTHVHRRVFETSQFVLDVLQPGGLSSGKGVLAAQKVRLMHASIRHLILAEPPAERREQETPDIATVLLRTSWSDDVGKPVNQEDMAYTLQTFAWVTVRSLRQLDAGLTARQEEAVIHAWNVVGHILGIRHDLMPDSVAEAELIFETFKQHVAGSSEENRSMTAALYNFLENFWTGHVKIESLGLDAEIDAFRFVPRMLMHEFLDAATAELLAVPKESGFAELRDRFLEKTLGTVVNLEEKVFDHSSQSRRLADFFFHVMLERMVKLSRGFERQLFAVPTSLARAWKIVEPVD